MPHPHAISPRRIAADILTKVDPRKKFIGPVLEQSLEQTREKQRATDLVLGTIKNRALLDSIIEKVSDTRTKRIQAKTLNVLRVAAYELVYCPQTAQHAIVNEAVECAKLVAGEKHAGFVNAVLREAARHIINRNAPLDSADPKSTIPQTLSTGCQFDIEVLPDQRIACADYLAAAFSLPRWLVNSWVREYGSEQTKQICFASNRRPSVYLRPNVLKTSAERLRKLLSDADIDCEIEPDRETIKLTSPGAIAALPGFAEGLFAVQDLSANEPVRLLRPQPNWVILDLCAAPGTKTTQLAEMTGGRAKIIATDIDGNRLQMVSDNVSRLGLQKNITVVDHSNLDKTTTSIGPFDCVLLDVPCSNTGVLAKRPEVRYRITPKSTDELAEAQIRLLRRAAQLVKPSGVICYSTCSIQPAENNRLIQQFLDANPHFQLQVEKIVLPSADRFDHDGGFTTILVRT